MATTSFDKNFVIKNEKNIKLFQKNLAQPKKVKIAQCNLQADKIKGIELLKRQLLASKTC